MVKKLRLFCDTLTANMAIVWCVASPLPLVFTSYAIYKYDSEDEILGICAIVFMSICLLAIDIWCIPKWFAFIELDNEGMQLNTIYKKTPKVPYEELYNFQIAYYRHIYTNRYFLVLGRYGLTPQKLAHINHVSNSEDLVKIKLTKRKCRILYKILPEPQREKLKKAIDGDLSKVAFNIDSFIRRQERVKKKKGKKRRKKEGKMGLPQS